MIPKVCRSLFGDSVISQFIYGNCEVNTALLSCVSAFSQHSSTNACYRGKKRMALLLNLSSKVLQIHGHKVEFNVTVNLVCILSVCGYL